MFWGSESDFGCVTAALQLHFLINPSSFVDIRNSYKEFAVLQLFFVFIRQGPTHVKQ